MGLGVQVLGALCLARAQSYGVKLAWERPG